MTVKEYFLRPTVLFWTLLVVAFFTLPAATFLCEPAVFMTPFGDVRIAQFLLGSQTALPKACLDMSSVTDLSIHLAILSVLVAHFVTILILHFVPKTEEQPLLSNKSYLVLIIKTLFTCVVIGFALSAFAWWAFQTPEIAAYMRENTTLQSPAQTMLTLVIISSLVTIILSAWYEDRFAFWDATTFCLETLALVYEMTFLITGIDLVIVLLSLPFPAFTDHFNPIFPPMWREWYSEFK
jgi:hypothetical protein